MRIIIALHLLWCSLAARIISKPELTTKGSQRWRPFVHLNTAFVKNQAKFVPVYMTWSARTKHADPGELFFISLMAAGQGVAQTIVGSKRTEHHREVVKYN
jgi:hypothetical protein